MTEREYIKSNVARLRDVSPDDVHVYFDTQREQTFVIVSTKNNDNLDESDMYVFQCSSDDDQYIFVMHDDNTKKIIFDVPDILFD